MIKLYPFQAKLLENTHNLNKVGYYLDMGLGKSFVGSIKLKQLDGSINLVVCPKSMVEMWQEHFTKYIDFEDFMVLDLTKTKNQEAFATSTDKRIGIINYDLIYRRKAIQAIKYDTVLLDESSIVQNRKTKRSKAILNLDHKNIILLSGTPCAGKYERLWSQLHLLGWDGDEQSYWQQYVRYHINTSMGFPLKIVDGYKNVPRLKSQMRQLGCRFLKSDEVLDLPAQNFNDIKIEPTREYNKFRSYRIVTVDGTTLVGDTTLTKLLYERVLCGHYNKHKLTALRDLLQSTDDRVVVFYNYNDELKAIEDICLELDKPVSIVNGYSKDLSMYNEYNNSVTLIQYQAGAHGLNLQLANKMVYFTPPLSCELWMQSQKRINRLGQARPCFYYRLMVRGSVECKIYAALESGVDYTNALFAQDERGG